MRRRLWHINRAVTALATAGDRCDPGLTCPGPGLAIRLGWAEDAEEASGADHYPCSQCGRTLQELTTSELRRAQERMHITLHWSAGSPVADD